MIYVTEERRQVVIVRFTGDLSLQNDQDVRKMFVELLDGNHYNIAADLSQVGFLDSGVLGILVSGKGKMQQNGGDFRLFSLTPFVKQLFSITSLDSVFRIFDSEPEAFSSFD